jgi:creatinine amidohydrolase
LWWHEQSWPKIGQLEKELPVVVPLGSVEQHGHHLPLCVDSVQVTAIAERAEAQLADGALFLPTLWLGSSEHHKDFPGTISLPPSLYAENIKSIARSILRAGFRRIFFLNGHGGNETPAAQALTELVGECDAADASHLLLASWWQLGRDVLNAERHGMSTPSISHACEYETSLMLAVRPDLVDCNATQLCPPVLTGPWYHSEYGGKVKVFRRFHRLTRAGSMGAPTAASAAKGQSMLTALTNEIVNFVRDYARWPELISLRETKS